MLNIIIDVPVLLRIILSGSCSQHRVSVVIALLLGVDKFWCNTAQVHGVVTNLSGLCFLFH